MFRVVLEYSIDELLGWHSSKSDCAEVMVTVISERKCTSTWLLLLQLLDDVTSRDVT